MNRVSITGTMVRDLEIKHTGENGFTISTFSIANNDLTEKAQDGSYEKIPQFFDVTLKGKWGKLLNYFFKGQQVTVDGFLKQDTWEKDGNKRSRVGIEVDQFRGGKVEPHHWSKTKEQTSFVVPDEKFASVASPVSYNVNFDDDIPF